jgi:AraC-like DNA-binding protein
MIEWTSLSHEDLQFENYLPRGFAGIRMADARVATAKGEFGHLTFQSCENSDFCFHYGVVDLQQPLTLLGQSNWAGLYMRVVLENHILHTVKDADAIYIREGQLAMALANAIEAKIQFQGARAYMTFDACFSMAMVNRLIPAYPQLAKFFNVEITNTPIFLIESPRAAGPELESIIAQVLQDPRNRQHAELLLQKCLEHLGNNSSSRRPASEVLENIYAVEQMVADNIMESHLVPELARRASTNVNYFKRMFRWIFGIPPHQYIIRLRMRKARRLLRSGQSVKATAIACGYNSNAEFTKAFKKFWRLAPEDVRSDR